MIDLVVDVVVPNGYPSGDSRSGDQNVVQRVGVSRREKEQAREGSNLLSWIAR